METIHQSVTAKVIEWLKIPSALTSVKNPTGTCEHLGSQEGWRHQNIIQPSICEFHFLSKGRELANITLFPRPRRPAVHRVGSPSGPCCWSKGAPGSSSMTCGRRCLLGLTRDGVQSFILSTERRFPPGPTGSSPQTNVRAAGPEAVCTSHNPDAWLGDKII